MAFKSLLLFFTLVLSADCRRIVKSQTTVDTESLKGQSGNQDAPSALLNTEVTDWQKDLARGDTSDEAAALPWDVWRYIDLGPGKCQQDLTRRECMLDRGNCMLESLELKVERGEQCKNYCTNDKGCGGYSYYYDPLSTIGQRCVIYWSTALTADGQDVLGGGQVPFHCYKKNVSFAQHGGVNTEVTDWRTNDALSAEPANLKGTLDGVLETGKQSMGSIAEQIHELVPEREEFHQKFKKIWVDNQQLQDNMASLNQDLARGDTSDEAAAVQEYIDLGSGKCQDDCGECRHDLSTSECVQDLVKCMRQFKSLEHKVLNGQQCKNYCTNDKGCGGYSYYHDPISTIGQRCVIYWSTTLTGLKAGGQDLLAGGQPPFHCYKKCSGPCSQSSGP